MERTCFRVPADRVRQGEGVVERAGHVILIQLGGVSVVLRALRPGSAGQRQRQAVAEGKLKVGCKAYEEVALWAPLPPPLGWVEVPSALPKTRAGRDEGERASAERASPAQVSHRPLALAGGGLRRSHRPPAGTDRSAIREYEIVAVKPSGRSAPEATVGCPGLRGAPGDLTFLTQEASRPPSPSMKPRSGSNAARSYVDVRLSLTAEIHGTDPGHPFPEPAAVAPDLAERPGEVQRQPQSPVPGSC